MDKKRISMLSFALLLCGLVNGYAAQASNGSGGVVVRLTADKQTPRCIDISRDRVSLTLRRLVTTKRQGWFTSDTSVALKIDAKVTAEDKTISFPLMSTAAFGDVRPGQVSLPIEYPIVSGLTLTQDKVIYNAIGVEVTLINIKDPSKLGTALQALSQITSSSKLPIPASPYLVGATYLLQFANDAINSDIKKQNDMNNASVSGSLSLQFDPEGVCAPGGGFETTGTKAIIYSQGITTDVGYVDIKHTDGFCFAAELMPVFILRAARKTALPCDDGSYASKMKDVTNDYIAFYLNKFPSKKAGHPASADDTDYRESLDRCRANGISTEQACLGEVTP